MPTHCTTQTHTIFSCILTDLCSCLGLLLLIRCHVKVVYGVQALAHVFPEESSEGEDVSGSSRQSEEASLNAAYSLSVEALDYR